MLHLFAWQKLVAPGRLLWLVHNLVPAAESGQRLIGDVHPSAGELLVHPHEVLLAVVVQLKNLVAMGW